mmetsp:Transcript_373/g.1402  ORF Transcript_373/g.1402 Transcript_373/m.1402 type:complete len:229 (+) Transcript_373:508-1194(+)
MGRVGRHGRGGGQRAEGPRRASPIRQARGRQDARATPRQAGAVQGHLQASRRDVGVRHRAQVDRGRGVRAYHGAKAAGRRPGPDDGLAVHPARGCGSAHRQVARGGSVQPVDEPAVLRRLRRTAPAAAGGGVRSVRLPGRVRDERHGVGRATTSAAAADAAGAEIPARRTRRRRLLLLAGRRPVPPLAAAAEEGESRWTGSASRRVPGRSAHVGARRSRRRPHHARGV